MTIHYETTSIYVADMPKIKEAMKQIKSMYSDYDFARYAYDEFNEPYNNATGEQFPYCSDIISCKLTAFARDYEGVHFRVEILNMSYSHEIDEISFYVTWHEENGMKFDKDTHWNQFKFRNEYTFNVRRYKLDGDWFTVLTTDGVQASA